jgi:hypothetical protein
MTRRDPTITPAEYRRMKEEEEVRIEEERQRDAMARAARNMKVREGSGESRIRLQGIVGNAVIINGEMYNVGNTVNGVRILEIKQDYIIGKFKGKTFRKVMK